MKNNPIAIFLLIALSLIVVSCNRGNITNSSAENGEIGKNSSNQASAGSGGQVTVLTGEDMAAVKIRSTRFR